MFQTLNNLWKLYKPSASDRYDTAFMPKPVPYIKERVGIALVTMVKNEALYIGEWIAFHCVQGVRHIYVYDNGSTDDLASAIQKSGFQSRVTLLPWANFHMDVKVMAHNHALATFGPVYRWLGYLDVDEFLFPVHDQSLDDAFAVFDTYPVICFPWHMFGPCGNAERPSGLVIDHYLAKAPFPLHDDQAGLLNWKTFVDPTCINYMKVHEAYVRNEGFVLINERGERFSRREKRNRSFAVSDNLQLNHYYTRSQAEFEEKVTKGRAAKAGLVTNESRLREQKAAIEVRSVQDASAARYSERIKAAMDLD